MMKLYGHELSGNSYKVKLMLSLLGLDYEWMQVDVMAGEHKQPEFLALNPFGQIPLLVDNDTVLADAQAILVYLARQYGNESWLPADPLSLARVVRWLSTTAGEIRQGPESARLYHLFKIPNINWERTEQKSTFILTQLNDHLRDRQWLECDRPTIADIAAFPYVSLAPDGQIDLAPYPNILAWCDRIRQLPQYVEMKTIA
ncbi:glutathione S-transferase family protein [Roseofilum casamattae]|uniref:Glutathione S-transferase family protein n=1 Tax=Roseofilum casamattae BLCC-M143 TaxID=3022442 RepID=A0ABT7BTW1_9CYAN|nr:glutathione S-transferase family protein [Roseofilum casamattae]MDJ1182621.1 glutathione S-transferase family protein [Roseofilum casamattae BLCC-M143]